MIDNVLGTTAAVERALAATAARVTASVVEVRTNGHGAGAGTIWRREGVVITNHHVAARDQAEVALPDGRRFPARVAARDERNDLAVLRVPAIDLPALPLGDARALRPGELVLAVGHPFGVRHALTIGVVSATPRDGAPGHERELIAADVRLWPGNSGGPLTNVRGQVVGINAMVAGGLALAVPSHLAERLVRAGEDRPRLGVQVQPVTLAALQRQRIGDGASASGASTGLLVVGVRADGPAAAAGLLVGDILVRANGEALPTGDALAAALEQAGEGPVALGILRGDALLTIPAALGSAAKRAA